MQLEADDLHSLTKMIQRHHVTTFGHIFSSLPVFLYRLFNVAISVIKIYFLFLTPKHSAKGHVLQILPIRWPLF